MRTRARPKHTLVEASQIMKTPLSEVGMNIVVSIDAPRPFSRAHGKHLVCGLAKGTSREASRQEHGPTVCVQT